MNYFYRLLIFSFLLMTSCFRGEDAPAAREDDKIRADLVADLNQLESDKTILENHVQIARSRLKELSVNPKLLDISKKDLFQKEGFLTQIRQRSDYLKIKINAREKHFLESRPPLTKKALEDEYAVYLVDKEANPTEYPWRVSSGKKSEPAKAPEKKASSGSH